LKKHKVPIFLGLFKDK